MENLNTTSDRDNEAPQDAPEGSSWAQLSEFPSFEEMRVSQLKSNLLHGDGKKSGQELLAEYQTQQITDPPSRIEQARRKVLDALRIKSDRLEQRRNREAIPQAIAAYELHQKQSEQAYQEGLNEGRIQDEAPVGLTAAEMAALETDADPKTPTELSFTKKADEKLWDAQDQKVRHLKGERIQEMMEQDLNKRLTKINELMTDAEAGYGADITEMEYIGDPVKVINLKGHPMTMLTHAIDYKRDAGVEVGTGIAASLVVQPAIWTDNKHSIDKAQLGGVGAYSRNDNISTSYVNLEKNPNSFVLSGRFDMAPGSSQYIVYGFDHVEPMSLQKTDLRDGHNPKKTDGYISLGESDLDFFDKAEAVGGSHSYNEVLIGRYSETGVAKRPDYMVAENGLISDDLLNHAHYFGVPVVNIEREYYPDD